MKKIWIMINQLQTSKTVKNNLYLGFMVVINLILGGLLWILFGRIFWPGMEWLFCFMGYPAMFLGFFGGILYLYKNQFE